MVAIRIRHAGIELPTTPQPAHATLSVMVDGHRVWTFKTKDAKPSDSRGWRSRVATIAWPEQLRPRLSGIADFALVDAVTGERLASRRLGFGASRARIDLTDSAGRKLAINKWGRLGVNFETNNVDTKERLLAGAEQLLAELQQQGKRAFIVGGTLLGAVRNGEFLPNDDDADLGYLSEHSHPADLAVENFEIQRRLEAAGYTVVRHSAAHLQVTYRAEGGHTEHYVDVFTAFFKDGEFFEPIHMQAPLPVSAILPLGEVELEGVTLPAPADPEAWLQACYGKNWRTPDPAFVFRTPRGTRRRFHGWFGTQNTWRLRWNEHYLAQPPADQSDHSAEAVRFAALLPPHSRVLEVACGSGADALYLASLGHDVVAFDYAWVAIDEAQRQASARQLDVDFRVINLYDRRMLLRLAIEMRARDGALHIFARQALDGVTNSARFHALRLAALLVRGKGFAYLSSFGDLGRRYSPSRPETWSLPLRLQMRGALDIGLQIGVHHTGQVATSSGTRVGVDTILRKKEETA